MGYNRSSLIKGTCISPGTGVVAISDTISQPYLSWSLVPDSSVVHYAILSQDPGTLCEYGRGTKGSGPSLTRIAGEVIGGTAGAGNLTDFSSGSQDVYVCAIGEVEVLPHDDTDPSIATPGQVYFNSLTLAFRVYDGNAWRNLTTSTTSGGDLNYTFTQNTPSSFWDINHNLGKIPCVRVMDSSGGQIEGDVVDASLDQLSIAFTAPFSGSAFLN